MVVYLNQFRPLRLSQWTEGFINENQHLQGRLLVKSKNGNLVNGIWLILSTTYVSRVPTGRKEYLYILNPHFFSAAIFLMIMLYMLTLNALVSRDLFR